jgi:DnaK suppressor protein
MKAPAKKSTTDRRKTTKPNGVKYPDILRDLEGQRAAILAEAGVVLTSPTGLEIFPDVSDQASAEADQHFSFRIRERERKLLKKIDEALSRFAAKTYGICERCSGDIPYKRLKARPVTTLCIECKTSQEEEEKSHR